MSRFLYILAIASALRHSPTPEKHQIETMPGGVAMIDYDGDGRLDLFFIGGAGPSSLHRNLGGWRFEDVTALTGVAGSGYQMGVAVGDIDGDGRDDLFVTGVDRNLLYRNRGDGTFEPRPFLATGWSISAGLFDYDNDGDLDLFVVNYVKYDPTREPFCGDAKAGYRTYCHPKYYEGLANSLFRNDGKGNFTDVSRDSGIAGHVGKGMTVAFADYDLDGRLDVLVTNDTEPDFLFHNEGNGHFREVGMAAGIGMNDDGKALSSMGADFRDVDNDGRPDIFITALINETFPLFRGLERGLFLDITYPSRIGAATLPYSGWSAGIYDFDNDGRKDIFAANGDVNDNTERYSSRKSRQPNLMLWQQADGTFRSELLSTPAWHRGAAFGDLDNDGAIDIVVSRLGERPVLIRNQPPAGRHWLGLKLIGKRHSIGARVRADKQWNHATTTVGYASASDSRVHFGLGDRTAVSELEIFWPSGQRQILRDFAIDRYLTVREP